MKRKALTGKEIADFLQVTPQDYQDMPDIVHFGHGAYNVQQLLSSDEIFIVPEDLRKIADNYVPGDIWKDAYYGVIYLYLGQITNGLEVVLNLGGFTACMGAVMQGVIDSGEGAKIFFDEKLFTPHKQ